jgi:hypothetical protein
VSAEATAANGGSAALTVEGLVAGYGGVTALDGVTVTAAAAGITAVLARTARVRRRCSAR